ncbi:MAG: hypothetical protein L0154_20105 [Chloroflexi bacterium]|nr:hypothetical protein [Chloroflexota bacterium]
MFKQFLGAALTLMIGVGVLLPGAVRAQGDDNAQPANIIITIEGETSYNRSTWDDPSVNNFALPGTPLHLDDYLRVPGDSTVLVICADLSTVPLLADDTPECNVVPENPAFIAFDALDWDLTDVNILATDETDVPQGVDVEITDDVDQVNAYATAIQALPLDDDAQVYALAYMRASNGFYLDAINELQSLEDLQCTEERREVEINGDVTITSAPTTYLRLGEWFAIAGNTDVGERYLNCARAVADETGDQVTYALASVRLATLTSDADTATGYYQEAIERFNALTATDAMETVLDLCGSANCTRPE